MESRSKMALSHVAFSHKMAEYHVLVLIPLTLIHIYINFYVSFDLTVIFLRNAIKIVHRNINWSFDYLFENMNVHFLIFVYLETEKNVLLTTDVFFLLLTNWVVPDCERPRSRLYIHVIIKNKDKLPVFSRSDQDLH